MKPVYGMDIIESVFRDLYGKGKGTTTATKLKTLETRHICPECGSAMHEYAHMPASDHPEMVEQWLVCDACECAMPVDDYETYDCPIHGTGPGPDCPRC